MYKTQDHNILATITYGVLTLMILVSTAVAVNLKLRLVKPQPPEATFHQDVCDDNSRLLSDSTYSYLLCLPADWTSSKEKNGSITLSYNGDQSTYFQIAPLGLQRESVFDAGASVTLIIAAFKGLRAERYECPQENPCPESLYKVFSTRLIDRPGSWTANNEIYYQVGRIDEMSSSGLTQILRSLVITLPQKRGS